MAVVTDPHPTNAPAIRAYEKASFIPYVEGNHPQWGRSLLMACTR
ncbi:hypothetical protein ABI_13950 [Asticcacaulis biprosthecium C19]|uniref:Acetyltransferase n=1 Tax=Asticcacaulis biprosthecium C19 TaxID=715226 RepID=F4QIG7_9CAUL|nr:hypothetical protein ABI_13950 [Asticcacaulis biprosthecium C19]